MNEFSIREYKRLKILEKSRWTDSKNIESIEKEMLSILNNLLDLNPIDVISLTNLGALQSDMGEHDQALKTLKLAEQLNFFDSCLYENIGIVMTNLSLYRNQSKRYFEKSLQFRKNEFTIKAYYDPQGH